jgi:hypothetical protein
VTDIPLESPAAAAGSGARADEILVAYAGSVPQRRLTVLVRLLLAIPQLIVLGLLEIAAFVVVVISWFAALVIGRLPAWAAGFLTGWLRWYARVYAYLLLLTDRYPPFTLEDADYPVRVATAPGRLNRFAVLFRIILMIPAYLVTALAVEGVSSIALLVTWLIVLINGRMPDALYQAVAAVHRYAIRFYAYQSLLTATYPWGLFGDRPGAGAAAGPVAGPAAGPPAGAAPPEAGAPAPAGPAWEPTGTPSAEPGQPGYAQPGYGQPGYGQPGYGQPGPAGLVPPAAGPQAWRLVLSGGARNLVILFLALGVLTAAANGVLSSMSLNSTANRANAVNQVSRAHGVLVSTMNALQSQTAACQTNLRCVTREDTRAADAFLTFNSTLRGTAMPDGAAPAASLSLQRDTARIAADFRQLATVTSPSQYQQTLASSGLSQTLDQFDHDYQQLGVALGAVRG